MPSPLFSASYQAGMYESIAFRSTEPLKEDAPASSPREYQARNSTWSIKRCFASSNASVVSPYNDAAVQQRQGLRHAPLDTLPKREDITISLNQ